MKIVQLEKPPFKKIKMKCDTIIDDKLTKYPRFKKHLAQHILQLYAVVPDKGKHRGLQIILKILPVNATKPYTYLCL